MGCCIVEFNLELKGLVERKEIINLNRILIFSATKH